MHRSSPETGISIPEIRFPVSIPGFSPVWDEYCISPTLVREAWPVRNGQGLDHERLGKVGRQLSRANTVFNESGTFNESGNRTASDHLAASNIVIIVIKVTLQASSEKRTCWGSNWLAGLVFFLTNR